MIAVWLYLGLGACMFFGVLGYLLHKAGTPGEAEAAFTSAIMCGLLWPAACITLFFDWFDVER